MRTSERCLNAIKRNEGFAKYPVWDYAQYSVGYGSHCRAGEYPNGITKEQADGLLRKEVITEFEPAIAKVEQVRGKAFEQCEWDALVSFSYNVGTAWTQPQRGYTVYKYVVGEYDMDAAGFTATMEAWSKAGGVTLSGLLRRRREEAKMYLYGDYSDGMSNDKNGQEDLDMSKEELVNLIDERIKMALEGDNTKPSDWAAGEVADAKAAGITDGTRPQGYAKREEVAAMVLRSLRQF